MLCSRTLETQNDITIGYFNMFRNISYSSCEGLGCFASWIQKRNTEK